jgi:hypothetical protein
MKRNWTEEELLDHSTILENEITLAGQISVYRRMGFFVVLKFYQIEARFLCTNDEIPSIT